MALDAAGLASAAGAVLLFGSFPLATKTAPTGDGIIFQWCMCAGIYTIGSIAHYVQCFSSIACPQFVPLAALGGVIWCVSNLLLVPIVDCIGIGLAMTAWGTNEMIAGYLTGRFGWLGVNAEPIARPILSSVGVALAVASLLVLGLVQPNTLAGSAPTTVEPEGERTSLLDKRATAAPLAGDALPSRKWTDALTPTQRRVGGLAACVAAGFLSGSTFTPPQAVVDAQARWLAGGSEGAAPYPGASATLSDLLFSHFSGIILASTVIVFVYAAAKRNRPEVFAQSLLPAFVSGLIWGSAMLCWFAANARLSLVVAFPIVTLGPGIVSTLWGVFLFNEISGRRNFALLAASVALYAGASAAIVLSKA